MQLFWRNEPARLASVAISLNAVDLTSLEEILITAWLIQFIILLRVSKPAMRTLAVGYAHCNLVTQCMKSGDVIIAGALVIDITAGKYFLMNLFLVGSL